jgi:hypothetical protein
MMSRARCGQVAAACVVLRPHRVFAELFAALVCDLNHANSIPAMPNAVIERGVTYPFFPASEEPYKTAPAPPKAAQPPRRGLHTTRFSMISG